LFLGVIIVLMLLIAEPQIMLFGSFALFAASGPCRLGFLLAKRFIAEHRRRTRSAA
jgi:hypothetical protein